MVRTPLTYSIAVAISLFAQVVHADETADMRALIQQLSSSHAAEREDAERRLLENDRAVPYLRDVSLRNLDSEIRAECTKIIDKRKEALRLDMLRHLEELSRRGEFGRAVCVAVAWRSSPR